LRAVLLVKCGRLYRQGPGRETLAGVRAPDIEPRGGRVASVTIVLMGVAGSGKSTVLKRMRERWGWLSAEGDEFHAALNVAKMSSGQPLSDRDRGPWLCALAAWIGARETAGDNCVLACSALRRAYRDVLRAGHPSVRFVHLVAVPHTLQARVEQRLGHYMPASLLHTQLETLEPLDADEPGMVASSERPLDQVIDDVEAWLATGPQ
jgi:gluconokinase